MNALKKAAAASLSLIMLGSMAGCSDGSAVASYDFQPEDIIVTVDGVEISFDKYRYYFNALKERYDNGDETYWDGVEVTAGTASDGSEIAAQSAKENAAERFDTLTEAVETYLRSDVTLQRIAEENGIVFDEDCEQRLNDIVEDYKSYVGGDEAWAEYLSSIHCSEDVFREIMSGSILEEEIVRTLYADKFKETELKDYAHVQHILLLTNNAEYEEEEIPDDATEEEAAEIEARNEAAAEAATEALKAERYAEAEEILSLIEEGADFEELIAEYNEDPGMEADEDGSYPGYHFTYNEMVEEFEDAAFALEEGEVSGIVESSFGYHIIKRLPIDMDYIDENIISLIASSQYYNDYAELGEGIFQTLTVERGELFQYVSIENME